MCITSMVTDHWQKNFPEEDWLKKSIPSSPYLPSFPLMPPPTSLLSPEEIQAVKDFLREAEEFKRLKKNAEEIDRVTGQPDCIDPKKDEYVKKLEARVRELENFYSEVKNQIVYLEGSTQGPVLPK